MKGTISQFFVLNKTDVPLNDLARGLAASPQVAIGIECMQSRRLSETIQFEYKHYTNGKCIVPAFLATLTLYKSVHGDVDTMWSRCREQCNLSPTCHFIGRYVNGDNDLMRCDFIEECTTTIGTLFNDNVHQKIIPPPPSPPLPPPATPFVLYVAVNCYRHLGTGCRDDTKWVYEGSKISIEDCRDAAVAQSKSYFGMENGGECMLMDALPNCSAVTTCNDRGERWHMYVYRVYLHVPPPPSPPPSPPPPSPPPSPPPPPPSPSFPPFPTYESTAFSDTCATFNDPYSAGSRHPVSMADRSVHSISNLCRATAPRRIRLQTSGCRRVSSRRASGVPHLVRRVQRTVSHTLPPRSGFTVNAQYNSKYSNNNLVYQLSSTKTNVQPIMATPLHAHDTATHVLMTPDYDECRVWAVSHNKPFDPVIDNQWLLASKASEYGVCSACIDTTVMSRDPATHIRVPWVPASCTATTCASTSARAPRMLRGVHVERVRVGSKSPLKDTIEETLRRQTRGAHLRGDVEIGDSTAATDSTVFAAAPPSSPPSSPPPPPQPTSVTTVVAFAICTVGNRRTARLLRSSQKGSRDKQTLRVS